MRNAELNGVENCRFLLGDLKDTLAGETARVRPGVIVLDPPRAGVHEKVIRQICRLAARRIVYVSCNPATLARDLALLCDSGAYVITGVLPVDMFPHTFHIESVVCVDRAPALSPAR
jgi:23S rRNA (uracil1939-C5)-methyltransferase